VLLLILLLVTWTRVALAGVLHLFAAYAGRNGNFTVARNIPIFPQIGIIFTHLHRIRQFEALDTFAGAVDLSLEIVIARYL
jgi:hypothetical protein